MNDKVNTLLPPGFYDLLPPDARKETAAITRLLAAFESFGYAQVCPPLMEFESSLLAGRGAALSQQTFRIMDPISQLMMGIRPDITMQVARIATSRLGAEPRPLRLCYAGPILQVSPDSLQSERQLTQAGIELIGSSSSRADAEVMLVAAESLTRLGIEGVSIDINLPGLLTHLCPEAKDSPELQARISHAVSQRDNASISQLPLAQAATLSRLLLAAGNAAKALALMAELQLPEADTLRPVVVFLAAHCPAVRVTIDPLEFRGFGYHEGISFSLFARGLRHELGRGGRYEAEGETATGFTFYISHLLELLPAPVEGKRILLPPSATPDESRALRADGWQTLLALTDDIRTEAATTDVSYIWEKGKAVCFAK